MLCQSFAPNHVCVITPERLGLCGAYNWLDGKAAYEIDPTGPNQPLRKGECIDPVRGQWAAINDYVYANSKQTIRSFNAYSLMEHPMTSCGCFEAIVSVLPELNGVMIVNREYTGETPAGMRFSTLANLAGGGQQTPGMIGVGKAYVTSRKFIAADGGHKRIVWMPRELKEALREELVTIGERIGVDGFLDMIADETAGTDLVSVRAHLDKVGHPALAMSDITATGAEEPAAPRAPQPVSAAEPVVEPAAPATAPEPEPVKPIPEPNRDSALAPAQKVAEPTPASTPVAGGIDYVIGVLEKMRAINAPDSDPMAALQVSTAVNLLTAGANMLLMYSMGRSASPVPPPQAILEPPSAPPAVAAPLAPPPVVEVPQAAERPSVPATIIVPQSFTVPPEKVNVTVRTVTLGGEGTRTSKLEIGGAAALPFRHFEGDVGRAPAIAMEVFDEAPKNYPQSLRDAYGALLKDPAAMAKHCVERLGAQAISVRLAATHPDQGDRSPEQAAEVVEVVLKAVGVPVIVTGPSHYEKNNAVMKHIAATFAGENLLLNWVETDNYKTIAAAAMGYNHAVVAQTPIDVNMAKQLNILLTNMGVAPEKIIIDPMTGAIGYGLEYTYSVMERIRTSAFTGDPMLAMPLMVNPGFEVARTKESRAPQKAFPLWGPERDRGALLEIATAMSFINAGADLVVVYSPLAATTVKRKIAEMMKVKE
ncbi:MAG: acetyl-CoA decarbonylase/synthase complex subunit delta [Bryobacteraceae bacterium]